MQITIEDVSPVEKKVEFEVPWTEVEPRLDRAYDKLRREVQLKGFRPGRVPRPVLERLYRGKVEDDVAREIIEASLMRAISENQIEPVAPPSVNKVEMPSGKPFKFAAKVEIRSEVVPKGYTGIELSRRPAKVSDDDVNAAIEEQRRRATELLPIEGRTTLTTDDVVAIELTGQVGPHHVHRVGKDAAVVDLGASDADVIPGLVAQLLGGPAAAGKRKLAWTIPADATVKELAGKDVKIDVTIKDVRTKKVPALDDDFAKDTGLADTLEGLRAKVRDELLETDRRRSEVELRRELIRAVVKANEFPIARGLVERHAQYILNRARGQLMMAGVNFDPTSDPRMIERVWPDAEEEARGTILLQAIAEREGITADEGDIQKRIVELATARRENPRKLRQDYEREGRIAGVRLQIIEEKTLDKLMSQARITEGEAERLIVTPDEARAEASRAKKKSK